MATDGDPGRLGRHLALGTASFALSFAAWGLISASATVWRSRFGLSGSETGLLVAAPVLLGALARLPIGLLADRFGARRVLAILMIACAAPVAYVPHAPSFTALVAGAIMLGFAGATFAAGVSYVSGWAPPARRGTALGVFGVGNGGQSIAIFLGPLVAHEVGWPTVFHAVAAALVVWGLVFGAIARDAPRTAPPQGLAAMIGVLRRERLAWALAGFYFLTFGGFVAFSVYLPTLLVDGFHRSPADAGMRAAGFVALATGMRPLGGWLADRLGGARVLSGALLGVVPFALLLAWPALLPFTVGALGCAALLGVGNGAVFQQVPRHFPQHAGTVTGLVGAVGGLGGFFPPLLLGVTRDALGAVWPAFLLLAATALGLHVLARTVLVPRDHAPVLSIPTGWEPAVERLRAGAWATLVTALLGAAIVVGSRNLENFDPALVIYTFAVVFATWGIVYHYRVWLSKPPTAMYWTRGWQALVTGRGRAALRAISLAGTHLVGQTFIYRRSPLRWWMHQLLFWGCLLAAAVTFPLVFGWVNFTSQVDDPGRYVVHLFGFETGSFALGTPLAWIIFHLLDIAAVLVLAGIALALWRRMRDRGAMALQSFARDLFPLFLLFAVSVTGLLLTVSSLWMRGAGYQFLSYIHAVTVIATLLFLPFGKFFHIFQRPAQLGVKIYLEQAARGETAACARCGAAFASQAQLDDLAIVLERLGFDYRLTPDGAARWQDVCPPCKRKQLAIAQLALQKRPRGTPTPL
ncbi:MAG: MFS transporter [Deltaproteobacteria bacterium]|nr:MFS transporter [Deltaproteobacteria bacterium]